MNPNQSQRTDLERRRFIQAAAMGALALGLPEPWVWASKSIVSEHVPLEIIAFNRMAFGPDPESLERFRQRGGTPIVRFRRYVEEQLHPGSIADPLCDQKLATAALPTLSKSLSRLWQDHTIAANRLRDAANARPAGGPAPVGNGKSAEQMEREEENRLRHQPAREAEIATWLRAVYSRRQLQEVLVDFWHNHFNVYGWDPNIAPVFMHYDRDVIRAHAFGNFRTLLGAVARSPAMLFYLDNFVNQSGNPNENYARELFELHTLGVEHYLGTQDRDKVPGYAEGRPVGYVDGDVYEAARCFTGWRIANGRDGLSDTGEFTYFDRWHDRFQKIVLGRPIQEYGPPMKDGEETLDRVALHPGTSRHIASKLCRRLISDTPPQRVVEEAASVFREHAGSSDQIARVVRVILLSEEFRTTWGEKMKRPFEVTAAMLRATGADFYPSEPFLNNYQRAGQRLFQWPTPDGYPDARARWGGTSPMLERWRLANQIAAGALDRVKVDWLAQTPSTVRTPEALARYWSQRVLGRKVSRKAASRLESFIARGRNPQTELPPDLIHERVPSTVALVMMSPDFQWR